MAGPAVTFCPAPRTIRLLLEYDGTDFAGWQIQAARRTVQGELARALHRFLQEPIVPIGAGRTDAGTHALGQVAHFHTGKPYPPERMLKALNGLLPPDIAVLRVEEAAPHFHARYSATGKRYRYRISTVRTAVARRQVWTVYRALDLEGMARAAQTLVGTHDFRAFCKQEPVPDNFTCRVERCAWYRQGRERIFEITADRFLRHMVRIVVGTLVEVGTGQRPAGDLEVLLAGEERPRAGLTAPAQGLCLVEVYYPISQSTG